MTTVYTQFQSNIFVFSFLTLYLVSDCDILKIKFYLEDLLSTVTVFLTKYIFSFLLQFLVVTLSFQWYFNI